ncbi:hypothetical protein Ade02nite_19890 [Paractinoplanes deccanensis]|uniref:Small CPxCG-related zinc finger protein n=1 Tax=Paractinoplanes deccanensis TaxID=113561 RepID=A0ABQ3Y032_9ACTN|nr:hypothetical protein [Actinoplanes deccanensis]GID73348.1 hypothetical protein Ade02nite_19890 [Actinoplanes deccanensis]
MSCPTCSGPSRETVGMVCQTCGTDYAADESGFARLQPGADLHVCLTCCAVVVRNGIEFHERWHDAISSVAIETTRRVARLERK